MKTSDAIDRVIEDWGPRHFRLREVCAALPECNTTVIREYLRVRVTHGTLLRLNAKDSRGVLYCLRETPAQGHFSVSPELIEVMFRMGLGRARKPATGLS